MSALVVIAFVCLFWLQIIPTDPPMTSAIENDVREHF